MPFLETALAVVALAVALLLRPWRQLASSRPLVTQTHGDLSALWTPLLATLVILPWLWALPTLHNMPLQLQWSGACLVTLTLGWPLAVLGLMGAVLAVLRRARGLGLWVLGFAAGYLFFSAIDLKEARHSVFLLPTVVFFAVYLLQELL